MLRGCLRKLGPSGRHPELRPASGPALLAEATAAASPGPVNWAVDVGRDLASAIISEIPELGGGEGPFETLRMGTDSARPQGAARAG